MQDPSFIQSESSDGGAPLQYPNAVSDLDKKQQDRKWAVKMEAHSPRTAQILKAQQQIRNGHKYDSTVIQSKQTEYISFEPQVHKKVSRDETSEPVTLEQRTPRQQQLSVNQTGPQIADMHSKTQSILITETGDPTLKTFIQDQATNLERQAIDDSSESSDGAPLQYPYVVSDLNHKHDRQQVKNKMRVHSPETAQILKAQQEIRLGKDYNSKVISNAQIKADSHYQKRLKSKIVKSFEQNKEAPLQYPNAVSDLDEGHQPSMIEAHTPKTAQILRAQQQIRKGHTYDSNVLDKGQKKTESHVRNSAPHAEISESVTIDQRPFGHQRLSVNQPESEKANKHSEAQSMFLNETSDPILKQFINEEATQANGVEKTTIQDRQRIDDLSESSDSSNGAPLQYPNAVSDLDKKQQDRSQAVKMEAHSPRTAQILKAQQQIRNGHKYDTNVIKTKHRKTISFEPQVEVIEKKIESLHAYADSTTSVTEKVVPVPKSLADSKQHSAQSSSQTSIHRSKTEYQGVKSETNLSDEMDDFEETICRRLSIAHTRKYGITDIYETVPFFSGILKKRDRDDLKRALTQEEFQVGDVLFNYQDIGDKFYMIMKGEVTIELPDPEIPRSDFSIRYEQYKTVLRHIEAKAELERQKELVKHRQQVLEEMMEQRESPAAINKDKLRKDRSVIEPTIKGKLSSMSRKSVFKQKRAESVLVHINHANTLMTSKTGGFNKYDGAQSPQEQEILPNVEELSNSDFSSSVYSQTENKRTEQDENIAKEFDRVALQQFQKQQELLQLGDELKATFDAGLKAVQPKPFENQATDFDKLRKRVAYLSKHSKNEKNEAFVPQHMQIHSKLINEDQEVRRQIHELKIKEGIQQDANETDSDESIQEIKRHKKKQLAKVNLSTLSDQQIARLTMLQIANLEIVEPSLTSISQEEQEELLSTQWLTPQKTYERGGTFGERSLKEENDRRAGTAVCTATGPGNDSCIIMTLTRQEYKRFIEKIELKTQTATNMYLKSLPMFSAWPNKQLTKLQYALTEVTLIRNQAVYNEGDDAMHVYIICEGEFLLTKRVPVKAEHQIQLDKLIGPNSIAVQEQPDIEDQKVVKSSVGDMGPKSAAQTNPIPGKSGQQTLSKTKMHGAFKLIALSTGQLMGEDDMIAERPRLATATCVSQKGKVYRMDAIEFFKKLELQYETKIEFHKQLYSKQLHMQSRLEMIESIYNIKPSDILARVAIEKAEGTVEVDDVAAEFAPQTAATLNKMNSPSGQRQKSQSPDQQRSAHISYPHSQQAITPMQIGSRNNQSSNSSIKAFDQESRNPTLATHNFHSVSSQNNDLLGSQQQQSKQNVSKSPKKKKKSYFVAPKRENFNKVVNEPFEIERPNTFKVLNNTRKVHYPMMLQKYNVDKVDDWNIDDFRRAMQIIVKKDNDALFDKHLSKKSGRASVQNAEPESKRKFVNSVYLEQSYGVDDRASPQKIEAKGFYSKGYEQSQEHKSVRDLSKRFASEHSIVGNSTIAHHHHNSQLSIRHQNLQHNGSAGNSKFASISLGRVSAPYGDQDPIQAQNQNRDWLKRSSETAFVVQGKSFVKSQEKRGFNYDSSLQSLDRVSQVSMQQIHQHQFIAGERKVSVESSLNNHVEFMGSANVTAYSNNQLETMQQPKTATPGYQKAIPVMQKRAQTNLGYQTDLANDSFADIRIKSVQRYGKQQQQQQQYMGGRLLKQKQRGVYSMAPSRTVMVKNSGNLQVENSVMEKQVKQQLREQREAHLMQQSVPARILAQKQVKYFNVASTIRRPRRLTELV